MNMDSLIADLKGRISGEIRFDDGSRALYATDASNYRQVPIGVVIPKTEEDVIAAVEICRKYQVPILSRGAGTSLAGQCCNVAVILDFTRLNKILEINPEKRTARVQPGVILDQFRAAARNHGLTFGPDPATHNRCTFGGMIGNNACGVHSIMSGKTADNIEELEILTYDGLRMKVKKTNAGELAEIQRKGGRIAEIYSGLKQLSDRYADLIRSRFPKIPRRVSGYNLDELLSENGFDVARALVGTEGTCAVILSATLKLVPNPHGRALLVLGYPDIYKAADEVKKILDYKPIGLEGLDEFFVSNMKKSSLHLEEIKMLPGGNGWLIVEFGGPDGKSAEQAARKLMGDLERRPDKPSMCLFTSVAEQKKIWSVRESSFGATVFVPGEKDTYAGFEDSAVSPEKLGDYLRDLAKLYKKYDYYAVTYGHFGDGCIHTRLSFDLRSDSGIKKYRSFLDEATDLILSYGGSFSGEHGDGQTWGEFLPKMYGPEIVDAFRKFKTIWDPENKMNPGKVVNAYRSDENLKLKDYKTIPVETHFRFPEDNGDFARTTERCIGIGKCLKKDEGIMCPSYMVTGEEMHSTRGRAHLLHEMMRGEVVRGGWKDEHVKESLDLCLACKGCKSECPVKVDVATYKAEFLSHYYEGRLRPLSAYLFGYISQWSKLASFFPAGANFIAQNPFTSSLLKKVAGIAPQRTLPLFAKQTFKQWFTSCHSRMGLGGNQALDPGLKACRDDKKPMVILWPDTFNNYFYPEVAIAAVEVLEKSGYQVMLPPQEFCCGRPLYDFGMLKTAKNWLEKIMTSLNPFLEQGIPVIGLEPSCMSVFRDELGNLFPNDPRAKKLKQQSFFFSEFMKDAKANGSRPLRQKVLIQGHCHQKSVFGMESETNLLQKLGIDFQLLDSGCCGMAGAFGFEKEHYDISVKAGERVLLPAVRNCDQETLILTNGFSCREQIQQLAGRKPVHLAELLQRAVSP